MSQFDDQYLVKLKTAGLTNKQIATRLGIDIGEVERRWEELQVKIASISANGYASLCDSFNVLAGQYQLIGESLKVLGGAIGQVMEEDEIRKLIDENPEKTVLNLLTYAIVLRPFVPPDPAAAAEAAKQSQSRN